ncbi:MAG TPA: NAD(P)/FAD-dependent oxidoreductase [Actinomycetota bacterium]|nr:NAD(P)/FAD-dependent oxidoreductase [Actinomycetota bacterium]
MDFDAIVIGAGHNGLVAACALAQAGSRVLVLEARDIVGGACVTEEIAPGFRISTAAYSFSLFRPEIFNALQLANYGLSFYAKEPRMFLPQPDGRHFFVWRDAARTREEIAQIDAHDADAYDRWNAFWDDVAGVIRPLILAEPPSLSALEKQMADQGRSEMFRLAIAGSAADTVAEFFHSDEVQGAFVGQGIIGTFAGPHDLGTAFVMTYHAFGGELVDGAATWAYVRGGMGAVTQALAARARDLGVDIRTSSPVSSVLVDGERVTGIEMADGREIAAPLVLSNADPKRTFLSLVPDGALPDEFNARVRALDTTGSVVKVNLALSELPDFTCLPGAGPQQAGTIELSPSVAALDDAFNDAKDGRVSAQPYMEVYIQSVTDPSLAPDGAHVASCFAQYAPGSVPMEQWDTMREGAGDAVIDTLASYAPNVKRAIVHRQVLGPADLEERFGLTGGNIFHGEILPGQIFGERFAARTPIKGLYLCGSGAHPGGGVCGAPGWNAARAALHDR